MSIQESNKLIAEFEVIVTWNKYDEFPIKSSYIIQSPNQQHAEAAARDFFCLDFGFKREETSAYVINRYSQPSNAK